MTRALPARLAPVLALALFALPAHAGVRIELQRTELGGRDRGVERSVLLLAEQQLKMTRESGRPGMGDAVLFDAAKNKLWVLDTQERSYMEMDREQAQAAGDQVSSAMAQARAQMEAQLGSLPPEQRALVEQAMKGRMGAMAAAPPAAPEEEYRTTGERAEKQGHPCRQVEVWAGGEKLREHWVTDWERLDLQRGDVAVLEELGEFLGELAAGMGGRGQAPDVMKVSEELGGLPVVTTDYRDGRPRSETVLLGVSRQDVPASELRLPEGYRKQAMPGFGGR